MNGTLYRVIEKHPKCHAGPYYAKDKNYLGINEFYGNRRKDIVIKDENIFDKIKEGDIIFVEKELIFEEDGFYHGFDLPTLLCLIKDLEKLI